jgi:type IV pilus assembly protein PilY1
MYKGNKAANLGDHSNNDHCTNYQYDTSATSGNKNWYKVVVSTTSGPDSTDERTNFANWYSYYRTRILMMKTAASRAFKNLDSTYRVGFMTIHNTSFGNNSTSTFLNLADFDSTQKTSWYSKLTAIDPSGGTPLRKALADVGRLYGGQFTSITDPVQYSCQQNFAILATDGYWNGAAGYQLNGSTAVGDQDGATSVSCPSCDKGTYPSPNNGKTSNGLADVAYYYYHTDLRASMTDDVKPSGTNANEDDVATWQHMTTFTVGLGINGLLRYAEDYKSGGSTDYTNIKQGTLAWPKAVEDTATAVDDLWHAAVNGRGTYFSAQEPQSLATGLGKALATIQATIGAAAAAATSNLQPVAGDNYA